MSSEKTICIVGGGAAGTTISLELIKLFTKLKYINNIKIILISNRNFYIHLIAGIRAVSYENNLNNEIFIPYDKLFQDEKHKFKCGTLTAINDKDKENQFITIENEGKSEEIKFDFLVLATGSKWSGNLNFPNTLEGANEFVKHQREEIKAAKKILIIGGGAVGIETAGEIRDAYPDTAITIVHGGDQLLNKSYPDKFRSKITKNIKSRNIEIMLNSYIDSIPFIGVNTDKKEIKTRDDKAIEADYIIVAKGPSPNTNYLSNSFGSDSLDEKSLIKTEDTLQLKSHPTIYAAGDILSNSEQKQAFKVTGHAKVISQNIYNTLTNKDLILYTLPKESIVLTNGAKKGNGYLPMMGGIYLGNFLSSTLKSKELFVKGTRGNLGY